MQLVPCPGLSVETIRFWLASPEVVYLVIYLEATDEFIGEDVRDIVGRQVPEALADYNRLGDGIKRRHCMLIIAPYLMTQHSTGCCITVLCVLMALSGAAAPWVITLTHCDLRLITEPAHYQKLVDRLLQAHGYDVREDFPRPGGVDNVTLSQGMMHSTYEWTHPLFTEFGFGEDETLRIESNPMYVHGPCAVWIDAREAETTNLSDYLHATCERLYADGEVKQLLAFINRTHDPKEFGAIRIAARSLECIPQDLGSLTFNLLTATSIYLEFREKISWQLVNYLISWQRQA